ncbi:MAG: PQQ-dependent sugar dehydrogenase [Phycisphaerae bacterium]
MLHRIHCRFHVLGILLCTAVVTCTAAGGTTPLATVRVASGLSRPVYVTHPPGDYDRVFIVEQGGRVLILAGGSINATPFLDISDRVTMAGNEQGLLGLAFHPDFAANNYFYVNYTRQPDGSTVVSRFEVPSATPDAADDTSEMVILSFSQPQGNHNAGWLSFGPDGMLYIATGDGGGAGDAGAGHTAGTGNAQDLTDNLLGKILRIDVDSGSPYAIPPDNPLVGLPGDDEIWAFGLRNPWRNAFDSATGDLFIADVGQSTWEEIDFQPASSTGGENYGWRCMEGDHCFATPSGADCVCGAPNLVGPIHEYQHGGAQFPCSITGGEVYRGCALVGFSGTYFFADYCSEQIWTLRHTDGSVTEVIDRTAELDPGGGLSIDLISSFGRDAQGELYICDLNGEVYKIVPAAGVPDSEVPGSTCDDDADNDCDGLADCADADCSSDAACGPQCPAQSQTGTIVMTILLLAAGAGVVSWRRRRR